MPVRPGDNPAHPLLPPRIQEYQTSYPPVDHNPFAAPYGQLPSNLAHEIVTKHTLRPLILPILPMCSLLTATTASLLAPTAAAACCLQAWPVLLLPTSTSLSSLPSQLYLNCIKIQITALEVRAAYPTCESPSEHPLWSNLATRPTEVQDSEARRPRQLFN